MDVSSNEHGESEEYFYQPSIAKPGAAATYACVTVLAWAVNYVLTGHPLPWTMPLDLFGIMVITMLMMAPLFFGQQGLSYLLRGGTLTVFRFGRERVRVPLAEYRGWGSHFGFLRLRFATRSVWIVEGAGHPRQLFHGALTSMALQSGQVPPPSVVVHPTGRVDVALRRVSFGRGCITCGGARDGEVKLEVRRGIDILFFAYVNVAKLHMPVCRRHARSYGLWKHGVWLVYLAIAGAFTLGFMATWANPELGLALFTGLFFAAFVVLPLHRVVWHRLRDWKGLGIRATKLHADHQRVTFACANDEIRERLVAAVSQRVEPTAPARPG